MMTTHHPVVGFIGAGNMAHCLISGLIANGYPPQHIWASDPSQEKLDFVHHQFGINIAIENEKIVKTAEILILAVKPQVIKSVVTPLQNTIKTQQPLIISIAAGITEKALLEYINYEAAIVRCMPNVAAFVNSGATGMYANAHVTPLQRDLAESIMRAVGVTLWVKDEKLINTITALSGCGPAYFFLVMEALEKTAVELGLEPEDAHLLALQTALGAARLGLSTPEPIAELRSRVASKGGSTERALLVLEDHHVADAFSTAMRAAYDRAIELSQT